MTSTFKCNSHWRVFPAIPPSNRWELPFPILFISILTTMMTAIITTWKHKSVSLSRMNPSPTFKNSSLVSPRNYPISKRYSPSLPYVTNMPPFLKNENCYHVTTCFLQTIVSCPCWPRHWGRFFSKRRNSRCPSIFVGRRHCRLRCRGRWGRRFWCWVGVRVLRSGTSFILYFDMTPWNSRHYQLFSHI